MDVRFAYQANCWGPLGGNAVGVTSIGQLTYVTFGDMAARSRTSPQPAIRASKCSTATWSTILAGRPR